ncbi:MAG: ribonuclease D [Acidimicrobiales bacterium]
MVRPKLEGSSPGYRWVGDAPALESLVVELADEPVYGFDTEFHRERSYYPQLALVQVAWSGGIALVDPLAVDLGPLAKVLDGPGVAVAHAADQDLEVLERACGTLPARLFDTQLAAGFLGMSGPSLSSLVERLLGRPLTKGDRLTDWTRRPLTADQREYAASDVRHLLDLHHVLVDRLTGMARLSWAESECELLRRRSHQPPEPERAWWRLREARQLRGRSRQVAQTVAAWRERRAAAMDKPPRFILPDLAVLSMAHRPPRNSGELAEVRGLDGRHLRPSLAAELLEAVAEGLGLPEEDQWLPVVEDLDRRLRPAATLAVAWVGQRAAELHLDVALLATRSDLNALLRGDELCRLGEGWRATVLGSPLRRLVAGGASLALGPDGGLVLEERSHRPVPRTTGPAGVPDAPPRP